MPPLGKRNKLGPEALWDYALGRLKSRMHSSAELRAKLTLRSQSAEAVREVMAKLGEYQLLDDAGFAQSFASSRLENQGHGASRVLRDLRSRQIAPQTAEKAVRDLYGQTEESDLIRRYLERKYRSKDLQQFLKDDKNLASVYRRLRLAGFTSARSIGVLKEFASAASQLDEMETGEPEE